jgi:membrane-associated protease RseP (regulator of RpoE activity)
MVYGQPVISRETRRLLITVVISVAALWVLARVRFQERPVSSTPVPNVLAQLRAASGYGDLARAIADIRPGITAAVSASAGGSPALRIREDAALTLAPGLADTVLLSDRATGLAIVRHEHGDIPGVMPWVPRLLDYPRYLVAADVTGTGVALRPVFIGGLFAAASPLWGGDVWALPPATPIASGTFVFTTDGAFAGLAASHGGGTALVPATLLLNFVERVQQQRGEAGDIGIAVQALTPAIASATGANTGVVITTIDPANAAADSLLPTDVIEAINGEEMRTLDHWRARAARVNAGDTLRLRVRSADGVRDVLLTAAARTPANVPADDVSLGLRLRTIPKVGVEVLSVQPQSRAALAAIRAGDVVTVVDGQSAPTPAQTMRAFASLPPGGSLLVAITRGDEHRVVVIKK